MHALPNIILLVNLLLLPHSVLEIERGETHALYLSVVEIKLIAKGKSSAVLKVFEDDLNDALKSAALGNDDNRVNGINVGLYFNEKMKIYINEKPVTLIFNGLEKKNEALFIYFEFDTLKAIKKFKIEAPYFMELFPTQRNMVNVMLDKRKFFLNLDIKEPKGEVIF